MKSKNSKVTVFAILSLNFTLSTLTRDELNALATRLNVARGKTKGTTVANIAEAILSGKARVKAEVSVSLPPVENNAYGTTVFRKKFRSYSSVVSPGTYDKVTQPVS